MNKKILLIILTLAVICTLYACTAAKNGGENESTAPANATGSSDTADISDSSLTGAENGTKKDGSSPTEDLTNNSSAAKKNGSSGSGKGNQHSGGSADNDIVFEGGVPEKTTSKKPSTSTTLKNDEKETPEAAKPLEPATDKDGWITKWY